MTGQPNAVTGYPGIFSRRNGSDEPGAAATLVGL